ncbi:hypothetical protein DFH08DRAFT_41247 [Mycena albidolilacea]|uniref:Transmembrane protein n=1 Tax=Mycena albidolilacea TaxID=1033008 RepID=A0AAD7ACI3_9AGAR|nr:hypothetical protein DFH08DRAFT_41247 [Mycena albidolilacea]
MMIASSSSADLASSTISIPPSGSTPVSETSSPVAAAQYTTFETSANGARTITSTQIVSASSTPSLHVAGAASTSGPSFFQNTAAVAGVFTAVGLIYALLFIYLLILLVRRRRQRALEREMDAVSFVPASLRAIVDYADADDPQHLPSLDPSSDTSRSHGGHSGYSGDIWTQPQLPAPQQQQNSYGFPQQREYTPGGYGGATVGGARKQSETVQAQRARVYRIQIHAGSESESDLTHRPQSAVVHDDDDEAPPAAGDYLSSYTSPPPSLESGYADATSPAVDVPLSRDEVQERQLL